MDRFRPHLLVISANEPPGLSGDGLNPAACCFSAPLLHKQTTLMTDHRECSVTKNTNTVLLSEICQFHGRVHLYVSLHVNRYVCVECGLMFLSTDIRSLYIPVIRSLYAAAKEHQYASRGNGNKGPIGRGKRTGGALEAPVIAREYAKQIVSHSCSIEDETTDRVKLEEQRRHKNVTSSCPPPPPQAYWLIVVNQADTPKRLAPCMVYCSSFTSHGLVVPLTTPNERSLCLIKKKALRTEGNSNCPNYMFCAQPRVFVRGRPQHR